MQRNFIRKKILVPFTVGMIILALIIHAGLYFLAEYDVKNETKAILIGKDNHINYKIEQDAVLMHSILNFVKEDIQLQGAWIEKDRQAILDKTKSYFELIKNQYKISHFYFHNLDKTNFLRVHKPEVYGDPIARYTLEQADSTGKPFSGVELGVFETLTLRVVHPWIINGEKLGFIELGIDIGLVTGKFHEMLDIETIVTVYKKNISKDRWLQGQKMLNKHDKWDMLQNVVVFSSSLPEIPDQITAKLDQEQHLHHDPFKYNIGKESYIAGLINFKDAKNNVIGDIVIIRNISDYQKTLNKFIIKMYGIFLLFYLFLFPFFYQHIGKIQHKLQKTFDAKNDLIEEQKKLLSEVKALSGLLPICASCKKIRDDRGYWNQIEHYLAEHSDATFSHSICPKCLEKLYPEYIDEDEEAG